MDIHGIIIGSAILVISFFGLIGNFIFVYAIYKRREIRGKHTHILFGYLFVINYQSMMYLIIGFDMLFSLIKPFFYYKLHNFPYLLIIQIPCFLFGLSFPLHSLLTTTNNPLIIACNPPLAASPQASSVWNLSNLFLCAIVVSLYLIIGLIMITTGNKMKRDSKCVTLKYTKGVVRSASLITIFFCAS
ncbi:hypothetical protein PFISCL1PPCAC_24116, partial [Pristionchus fissidentatus]